MMSRSRMRFPAVGRRLLIETRPFPSEPMFSAGRIRPTPELEPDRGPLTDHKLIDWVREAHETSSFCVYHSVRILQWR
jgi:hypothetical protein